MREWASLNQRKVMKAKHGSLSKAHSKPRIFNFHGVLFNLKQNTVHSCKVVSGIYFHSKIKESCIMQYANTICKFTKQINCKPGGFFFFTLLHLVLSHLWNASGSGNLLSLMVFICFFVLLIFSRSLYMTSCRLATLLKTKFVSLCHRFSWKIKFRNILYLVYSNLVLHHCHQ